MRRCPTAMRASASAFRARTCAGCSRPRRRPGSSACTSAADAAWRSCRAYGRAMTARSPAACISTISCTSRRRKAMSPNHLHPSCCRPPTLPDPASFQRRLSFRLAFEADIRGRLPRHRRAHTSGRNRNSLASARGSREETMNRIVPMLAAGAAAVVFAASAQAADVSITRLDCGTPQEPVAVNQRFSDTFTYGDMKRQFVFSCYVIKHGDEYLLWDTGHSMTAPKVAPKVSVVDQLAKLNIKPEQIKYVGISHYHADHTGQVGSFPKAELLIGTGDWNAITSPHPAEASITSRSSPGPRVTARSRRSRPTRTSSATAA